jgi:diacylglycerol kinase (ATP)
VPDELNAAWEIIESNQPKPVDVIELQTPTETKYFANIATGGNSHRVTESITDEMKQTWGALCYLRGAIGVLTDLKTFQTSISFDGGPPEEFDAWNIIVANGKTSAGRLEIAPKAKLDDGLLDVVIVRDGTLLNIARMAVQYLASDYIESDQIEYRQAKSISIRSEPPLLFSIDGDLVEQQPIKFQTHPSALKVVAGTGFAECR